MGRNYYSLGTDDSGFGTKFFSLAMAYLYTQLQLTLFARGAKDTNKSITSRHSYQQELIILYITHQKTSFCSSEQNGLAKSDG